MRRNLYKAALLVLAGLGVGVGPAAAQAPPAFAARPAGPSATMARIEMAWQANPITAGCALTTSVNRNVLEVHGEVPNEEARRMALAVARDHCHMPVTDHMKIRPFAVRKADTPAPAAAPVVRTPVAPPVAPTVSRPREVVTPAGSTPVSKMVLAPAPTTSTPTAGSGPVAAPEEMHLLRLPNVSGTGRPAPTTTTTLPAPPPRTTQFAATREPALEKAPATSVAQVTPTVAYPAAKPIEKPAVEKAAPVASAVPAPAKLPLAARGGDEAQDLAPETTKPIPADALNPEALKGRFKDLSGKLARDVNVSVNLAGDFTVKLVLVSTAAEEQLLPRLLAMPELSTGRIRLEIHVPQ